MVALWPRSSGTWPTRGSGLKAGLCALARNADLVARHPELPVLTALGPAREHREAAALNRSRSVSVIKPVCGGAYQGGPVRLCHYSRHTCG